MSSFFVNPNSEAFFRMGLAKSVFKSTIYNDMPLDVYIPSIVFVQRFLMSKKRARVKLYMSHDAYFMFYRSLQQVVSSMKKMNKAAPVWHTIVSEVVKTENFAKLNSVTAKSDVLAQLAAVQFLSSLLSSRELNIPEADKQLSHALQQKSQPSQSSQSSQSGNDEQQGGQGDQTTAVGSGQDAEKIIAWVKFFTKTKLAKALNEALKAVKEYSESSHGAWEAVMMLGGRGGLNYSLDALSVASFLEHPEEFRKRVRLLSSTAMMMRLFSSIIPTSFSHQQAVSLVGGLDGVTRMWSEMQLPDVLPSELALAQLGPAGRALLASRIAQRQLTVWQRSGTIKPVVFVDKSGSMAGNFPGDDVAKISVATGFALAVYRRLDADVYLFDTEVEKMRPQEIVKVLLTIKADGGTDISAVLEEILRIGKRDYVYIIISDGISDADEHVLKKWVQTGLAKRTRLVLIDYYANYRWLEVLRGYGNVFNVKSLADFTTSVKNIMLR